MVRRALVLSAFVAACVPTKADPPPIAAHPSAGAAATAPPPGGKATDAPDPAAARTPMPEGPPKWKSVPTEQNGFHVVLDGLCSDLVASRGGSDVVVHYGGASGLAAGKREGGASFVALRDDGLEAIGDPRIDSPVGIAGRSASDFWVADSTGSRSSEGAVLHRYAGGTWKRFEKDQTNIHAWLDGGIIGSLGMAATNGDLFVVGSATKPPIALHRGLWFPQLSAFPTGEVLVVAMKDDATEKGSPLFARSWAPGKKVVEHALSQLLPGDDWPDLHEVAPDEVYVLRGGRVVRWDGSAFHGLATTKGGAKIVVARRAAPDDLWVLTEAKTLERLTTEGALPIATPERVAALDGAGAAAWIAGVSGKLYRRDGDGWKAMALAPPAFSVAGSAKATQIVVAAPDDVLVVAKYWEKGLGWKDQELHTMLLRTKRVKETLRCNEPDPENNNIHLGRGFQSWPPMATDACKSPFAVLARRSNAIGKKDDWPRLRAALGGHPELGDVSLVEFVSGDRTFVGTKATDLETARKIVALATKRDRLRPEIVCGEPDPKRAIPLAP